MLKMRRVINLDLPSSGCLRDDIIYGMMMMIIIVMFKL